jgi:hypothetical protein
MVIAQRNPQPKENTISNIKNLFSLSIFLLFLIAAPLRADLKVNQRKDVITLSDGTKLECTILIESVRGYLVLVEQKETGGEEPKEKAKKEGEEADREDSGKACQIFIPFEQVKEVLRGQTPGPIKGFQTEVVQAQKVVKGTGFRKAPKKMEEGPVNPKGPIKPAEPLVPLGGVSPSESGFSTPTKLSAQELSEGYMARIPRLRELTQTLIGGKKEVEGTVDKAIKSDPNLRHLLDSFLQILLNPSKSSPNEPTRSTVPSQEGVKIPKTSL